jgi:hypothetical protein
MSGQSLIAVVSTLVESITSKPTTTDERLHQFVCEMARFHVDRLTQGVSTSFDRNAEDFMNAVMNDSHRVQRYGRATIYLARNHLSDISSYLKNGVPDGVTVPPEQFDLDNETALEMQIGAFKMFLDEHQYDTYDVLTNLGYRPYEVMGKTLGCSWKSSVSAGNAHQLWDQWRRKTNQPDISVSVYLKMVHIAYWMVYDCVADRVELTLEEKEKILLQARKDKIQRVLAQVK